MLLYDWFTCMNMVFNYDFITYNCIKIINRITIEF